MVTFTYEQIVIDLSGNIQVSVFTLNTAKPGRQIRIDHTFAAGTSATAIDTAISSIATLVWSLQ